MNFCNWLLRVDSGQRIPSQHHTFHHISPSHENRKYASPRQSEAFTIHCPEQSDNRNPMTQLPNCPQCNSEYTYEDGDRFVCPECAHEWPQTATADVEQTRVIHDAHGNVLQDGDTVVVIKDLKV